MIEVKRYIYIQMYQTNILNFARFGFHQNIDPDKITARTSQYHDIYTQMKIKNDENK